MLKGGRVMTQFDNEIIIFNGCNLTEMLGFNSYSIKNTSDKLYGITRSIETQDSINGSIYMTGFKNSRATLDVELARVDKYGNTTEITDGDMDELARILFCAEDGILEVNGLVYYGSFIDGTSWRNGANHGYVCLKFEMLSPYAYSPILNNYNEIVNEEIIEIYNYSNAEEYTYLDLIVVQGGIVPITINNLSIGESVKINNLAKDEEVEIHSETKDIFSKTYPTKNVFKDFEYTRYFPRLRYGKNRIKVTGNCTIIFKHQEKMFVK